MKNGVTLENPPDLVTERLLLRRPKDSDADAIVGILLGSAVRLRASHEVTHTC